MQGLTVMFFPGGPITITTGWCILAVIVTIGLFIAIAIAAIKELK